MIMSHLIAKTKGSRGAYIKIISDKVVFELPDNLDNAREYQASYILEDDEWYAINRFSAKSFCIPLLQEAFNTTNYAQINRDQFFSLEYLCYFQNTDRGDIYFFQKLSQSKVIRKNLICFSDEPDFISNRPIIVIEYLPHAIYIKSNDTLYFRNLSTIASIFTGIDSLYREATNEETESFLANDFIQPGESYSAATVKNANRKRIAMAMDTLSRFSSVDKRNICTYIRDYCTDLSFDEETGKFSISSEDELKKLLFGIEQRYYTTLLGSEKRLANSVILLP